MSVTDTLHFVVGFKNELEKTAEFRDKYLLLFTDDECGVAGYVNRRVSDSVRGDYLFEFRLKANNYASYHTWFDSCRRILALMGAADLAGRLGCTAHPLDEDRCEFPFPKDGEHPLEPLLLYIEKKRAAEPATKEEQVNIGDEVERWLKDQPRGGNGHGSKGD